MTLKEKIKQKQKLIATHVSLDEVCTARIAGLSGVDFVCLDFCMLKEAYSQAAQNLRAVHLQQK